MESAQCWRAGCAQDACVFFLPEANAEGSVSAQLGLKVGPSSVEHLGSAFGGCGRTTSLLLKQASP